MTKEEYKAAIIELLNTADAEKMRHLWHFIKSYLKD